MGRRAPQGGSGGGGMTQKDRREPSRRAILQAALELSGAAGL